MDDLLDTLLALAFAIFIGGGMIVLAIKFLAVIWRS